MKVRELVHASARIIGIIASGENMTDAEMSDAVSALNMMLGQWSASRDYVFSTQDIDIQFNDNLKAEYYFGNLEDLYDKHYLGLDHQYKINDKLSLLSKFKYFNAQDSGSGLDIDSQNIGLIETLKYDNHSFGIGYQKIVGDAYPIPDGFLPELYFINWNVTGFFKKEEQSYHFIYAYNFKDYIPGLNAIAKYSYGDQIKMDNGKENQESELNLIGSYNFQQPALKGVGLQYLYAKYDVDYGKDFDENRVFLTYTKKF